VSIGSGMVVLINCPLPDSPGYATPLKIASTSIPQALSSIQEHSIDSGCFRTIALAEVTRCTVLLRVRAVQPAFRTASEEQGAPGTAYPSSDFRAHVLYRAELWVCSLESTRYAGKLAKEMTHVAPL
jgi:hypothetical protein